MRNCIFESLQQNLTKICQISGKTEAGTLNETIITKYYKVVKIVDCADTHA